MSIFIKNKTKRFISAALCASMITSFGIASLPVQAEEMNSDGIGYASTRERIEAEYTPTDNVTDWSDSTQKNYQIADGATDTDYLIKAVEWADIEKGEAKITLAGANTEESVALFVFTTCTDHMTTGSDRNGGLMPDIVLQDIVELQEMYDRVDCICVNGPDLWENLRDGEITYDRLYSRTTDSSGCMVWNPSKFTFNCAQNVANNGGLVKYYSGITPVKSFTKIDSPLDVKEWLQNLAWVYGCHVTASELAAVRAYLFGDISIDTYADSMSNPSVYREKLQSALDVEPRPENMVNRPAAIYVAGDSYVTMPNAGSCLALSRKNMCEYSTDDSWIKFLADYYTSYGGGEQRYFSLTSSRVHLRMEGSYVESDIYSDLTIKAYTAMFHPEIVAGNIKSRIVKNGASGTVTFSSQGTAAFAADYEYQEDFSTAGVLTPDKTITISDTVSDVFDILDVQATTINGVDTSVEIEGNTIRATANEYLSGDELTVTINVKLRKGIGTQIEEETVHISEGDSILYDGNIELYTVAPKLVLPGAEIITTNVKVVGNWDDDNDRDGIRPESALITLVGSDGSKYTAIINEENSWTATFNGLIKSVDGEEVTYSFTSDMPDAYSISKLSSDKNDGNNQILAVYTHKPQTKTIKVSKTWDDKDNVDGIRPEQITVKLVGSDGSSFKKYLYANNNWTAVIDDLYAYYDHGKEMVYSLEEISVDGYSASVTESEDGFNISNVHTQELRTLAVNITWNDDSNRDGIRPQFQRIMLSGSDGNTYEAEVKATENWQYSFENIPVNAGGKAITYTLSEKLPSGYEGRVLILQNPKGFEITNTHVIEETEISVSQTWIDEDNRDGIRPDKLKVSLKGSDGKQYDLKLSEGNGWKTVFMNLPVYYDNGKKITYVLSEVTVSGYSTNTEKTTDGNGYTVTNTHSPLKRNISVYKKWDDSNDLDGLRQDVVLTLKGSDGSVYNGKIAKDAIDQEYTFKNLYAYDSGKEIEYTIEEQEMKEYTVSIAEAKDGFAITNTHKAVGKKTVTEDNPDKWDDSDTIIEKIIDIPKTGDSFKLIIYGLGACIALAAGIGTGVISVRKKKDEE